ncbi:hypothetical protein [Carboxylicivirga linearis]|uniref:Uncharacterized protein n=1 Tax=Carboxylicivirga linearis TaxID=1628157 RepID=A0ABS5JS65_9BACT|nr:hypothetical protein [Carboxylicivirga linearis]MBS2097695.1 hypothetical protein [Carboxylicivirga linearis]
MCFRYLSWTKKLLSSNKELEKVDQLTVHYANGSIKVYTNNELQMSLIDRIRQSSYLFVVVNYMGGFTSVLCPTLDFSE